MGVVWPVGETQCVLRWLLSGDPEEQVITIGVNDTVSTDPASTAVAVYNAATLSASITPIAAMLNTWTFVGVTCYLQSDPGQIIGEFNNPITATTGGTLSLPTNCAFLVHKVTAESGRSGKGRMYCPAFPLGEADVGPGGLIIANYAVIQARWDAFYDGLLSESLEPKLFHTEPRASTDIDSFLLDTRIATQRRRMRG